MMVGLCARPSGSQAVSLARSWFRQSGVVPSTSHHQGANPIPRRGITQAARRLTYWQKYQEDKLENPSRKTIELKDVLSIVFKLTDYLNFQWNFYVVFNVAMIGWLLGGSNNPWSWQKKLILSAVYLFFILISITLIRSTYGLLLGALDELASAGNEIEFRSEKFGEFFKITKPFNKQLSTALHIIADFIVLLSIWTKGIFF